MEPRIAKLLEQENPGPFVTGVLRQVNDLLESSRKKMAQYYDDWDRYDDAYRGLRTPDKADTKAAAKGEPTKLLVQISKSQIETFVAFSTSLLFQRELFFELIALEEAAERPARVGEALVQRDLDWNNFYGKVDQFCTDIAKYGVGVMKCDWVEEKQLVEETVQGAQVEFLGSPMQLPSRTQQTWKTKYQGNRIQNISPYQFFPDPALPLSRFQEGHFCGSDEVVGYAKLKRLERDGAVAGLQWVRNFSKDALLDGRKLSRLPNLPKVIDGLGDFTGKKAQNLVLSECVFTLVPNETDLGDGLMLGPEDYPVKFFAWVANDHRLIRFEKFNYVHDQFPYVNYEFAPDQHHFVNDGLAGTIEGLQNVMTWYINSHISSVRKVINNRLVVDPQGVEWDDVMSNNSVIRMKPGAARIGADRWVHQLQVQDVTGNHMEDADAVHTLIQVITGINDNALGQFHTGRRSATEARSVQAGTAARLKKIVTGMFYSALMPLAEQMISNLRSGLSVETYVRVIGLDKDPTLETYATLVKATKADIIGEFDFAIFDATLPSERALQAETLESVLQLVLASPLVASLLGFDLKLLILEILRLRGLRNPQRLSLGEAQRQMMMQQAMMGGQQQNGPANGNVSQSNGQPAAGQAQGMGGAPGGASLLSAFTGGVR